MRKIPKLFGITSEPLRTTKRGLYMNMIKLSDFARQQGVTSRAVQQMIKKYETDIEGHFERKGQDGTWIDSEAQEFLRSKMLKKPVVVYDETATPLLEELQRIKDENKQLRERYTEVLERLAQSKDYQLHLQTELMEQKLLAAKAAEAETALTDTRERLRTVEGAAVQARKKAVEAESRAETAEMIAEANAQEAERAKEAAEAALKRASEAEAEAERLRGRSLWQRIRNK